MRTSLKNSLFLVLALLVMLLDAPVQSAAWQPPQDAVYSEKQLTNYIDIQKQAIDNLKAAGKAIDGTQSSALALAVVMRNDAKFKELLAAHAMTQEEYEWVSARTWEAWGAVMVDKMISDGQKALTEQKKSNEAKLADLKDKLATYEKSQAQGRRVMTKDERQSAIDSAKSDQQSALDEAKQHTDEIKQAQTDQAKAEEDAKAADALAKNPPADVSADDRPGFVDQKKAEAQQARDTAKEAMDKITEYKKAAEESGAKAASAGKRVADPDLPVNDDEKAEVKKTNDDQITALKNDISETQQGIKLLDESAQNIAKAMQDQKAKVPAQNEQLLLKHKAEFEGAIGIKPDRK